MNKVYVKYNPYIVKTEFIFDGRSVGKLSNFYDKQENVRLQEWIEPIGKWKGFFQELYEYFNSSEKLEIEFKGTKLDFQDLKYAYEKYGKEIFDGVDFKHIESNNQENRLEILKKQFKKIQRGPVKELQDEKIRVAFQKALSSEFDIVVVAPMSSGKSTLINAILGSNLLPEANKATTATITRIKDVDGKKEFYVNCKDKEGHTICADEKATLEVITNLNEMADRKKNIDVIKICGDIKTIPSDKVNTVFVDTPGGNNSQDGVHKEIMKYAIRDENKGMILFVFNFTQLGTDDCDTILEIAAEAMKNARTGKQSRDRFIFVCNKMDAQDPEKEPQEKVIDSIKEHLKTKGIIEPNLFLTDARVCKLVRMKQSNMELTQSEDDTLDGLLKAFNRESRRLFTDAPISEEKKKEFLDELEKIARTGEKRSIRAAEINSGIPALEYAIRQYIEKYAQAIKIKTIHDTFMKRVEELNMKSKCEEKWSRSREEYEKMRQELKDKKAILEKDKKLNEFKQKVASIEADYSKVEDLRTKLVEEIQKLSERCPEKIERDKADDLLRSCHKNIINIGNKAQRELEVSLENCVYNQSRKILDQYADYLKELDRRGLLNIDDYSFKKISGFDTLTIEKLENAAEINTEIDIVGSVKKEKPGFFSKILRMFKQDNGWYWEDQKQEFVLLKEIVKNNINELETQVLDEIEKELERAKANEKKVKEFANEYLSEIENQIKDELKRIAEATADEKKLKNEAEKNRKNMEWLSDFVKQMSEMLDV